MDKKSPESPKSDLLQVPGEGAEGKHLSAGKCIKLSGYLQKKKNSKLIWQKRFVSLDKGILSYFADSSEYTRDLKGTIKMKHVIHTVVSNLDAKWSVFNAVKGGCQFETHLEDGRIYYWAAETPQLCQQWVEAIFSWSAERERDHTVVKLDKVVNNAEVETADMKGFLKKKNPGFNFKGLGIFKKRYFVLNLKSKTLKWWDSDKECDNGDPEKGVIDLRDIKDIKESETTTLSKLNPTSKAGCEFDITLKNDERVYQFSAETPQDMKMWMESIFKLPMGFDKLDETVRANARQHIWGYHDNIARLQSILGVDWSFDCDYLSLYNTDGIDSAAKPRIGEIVFSHVEQIVTMFDHFCRKEQCLKSLQETITKKRVVDRIGWNDKYKATSFHQPIVEDGVLYIQHKADNFWMNLAEITSSEFATVMSQQMHGFEQLSNTLSFPWLRSLDLLTCFNFMEYADVYTKQLHDLSQLTGCEWQVECDYVSFVEHKELESQHRYKPAELLWSARFDAVLEFFKAATANPKYKQSLLNKASAKTIVLFKDQEVSSGHQQVVIDHGKLVFQCTITSVVVNLSEIFAKDVIESLFGEPKKVRKPSLVSTVSSSLPLSPSASKTNNADPVSVYKPSVSQAQPSVSKKPGVFANLFGRKK